MLIYAVDILPGKSKKLTIFIDYKRSNDIAGKSPIVHQVLDLLSEGVICAIGFRIQRCLGHLHYIRPEEERSYGSAHYTKSPPVPIIAFGDKQKE